MIITILQKPGKAPELHSFSDYETYNRATFSPAIDPLWIIDTERGPAGRTYTERREACRQSAIDYSLNFCDVNISYMELAEISRYYHTHAARLGLLREFRENGII